MTDRTPHLWLPLLQAMEREGALDKLRTKQFAQDRYFFQQVCTGSAATRSLRGLHRPGLHAPAASLPARAATCKRLPDVRLH